MKKLSIILLALGLALMFTVPAMAIHLGNTESPEGSIGINGRYQFDGQIDDVDGVKDDYFDDDLDVGLVWVKGDIKALVGLEIADTNPWEGSSHTGSGVTNVVDNYYVEWTALDALKVKIGEYGYAFGRAIGTDGAGARNIELIYSLDVLDIHLALTKEDDGSNDGLGEDDDDVIYFKLVGKELGPFTKLALASYTQQNDISATENSYLGLDLAIPLGPVDIGFEYGANGGDLDGTFMVLELGFMLGNFDLGLNYFTSTDDYLTAYDGNDWAPALILGDNINGDNADMSTIWLTGGYDISDKLNLQAVVVVAAENDAGDAYGTEVDVAAKFKIADNISWALAYGAYTEGDGVLAGDVDRTETFTRLQFTW
jgi:hypothetical protein